MATPITSGNAALLRQYLLGVVPSGTESGSNPKVPSGALMKAMLINSAVTLGGTYQQNQQLGPGTAPGSVQATPPDPNRALAGRACPLPSDSRASTSGRRATAHQMDRVLFQATSDGKSAGDKVLLIDGPRPSSRRRAPS